jgi:hypothetical protein
MLHAHPHRPCRLPGPDSRRACGGPLQPRPGTSALPGSSIRRYCGPDARGGRHRRAPSTPQGHYPVWDPLERDHVNLCSGPRAPRIRAGQLGAREAGRPEAGRRTPAACAALPPGTHAIRRGAHRPRRLSGCALSSHRGKRPRPCGDAAPEPPAPGPAAPCTERPPLPPTGAGGAPPLRARSSVPMDVGPTAFAISRSASYRHMERDSLVL